MLLHDNGPLDVDIEVDSMDIMEFLLRLNRTHGTFGVSRPDGRNVRIVAKLTDIPVLVSNACHFIYYLTATDTKISAHVNAENG
ncbi:hypothetical protein ACLKA7_015236 [Drosophila subpalustris]